MNEVELYGSISNKYRDHYFCRSQCFSGKKEKEKITLF